MPTASPEADVAAKDRSPSPSAFNRAGPALGFFLVCLAVFLYTARSGWWNRIVDGEPFREAQTAITAYYMVGQAPRLDYETPVLGPPWSIPFELSLYQWAVAGIVTVFHTPLPQTGRAVSMGMFLLTLVPLWFVLRELRLSPAERW